MTYTAAQLTVGYTAANDGVTPSAALLATINSQAAASATGQLTDAAALGAMIKSGLSTTDVAVQAYQFFTGKTPSKAGLDFLENSPTNTTDLNDPYYAVFNDENRYINFAANLGLIGDGTAAFKTTYGAMTFSAFVGSIYETIIGASYINAVVGNPGAAAAAIADIISRQSAFLQTAKDRGLVNANSTAAQIDIATKAAAVGYLLYEGAKADIGIYAAGADNFVSALISGAAQYNVNLLTTYSVLGGGLGSPVPSSLATNLTAGQDNFVGTTGADTVNGIVYSDSGTPPFVTTYSLIDTLNGGGGTDTLNLTVTRSNSGTTGPLTLPMANVSSFEIINITALSDTVTDQVLVSGGGFNGASTFNSYKSISTVNFTNLPTGAVVGLISPDSGLGGPLSLGYASLSAAATLNITGNGAGITSPVAPITITSVPTTVTINVLGSAENIIAGINLGGGANNLVLNVSAPTIFEGLTGFANGASITVNGTTSGDLGFAIGRGIKPGVAFATGLPAGVGVLNASGLTATGILITIGANPALNIFGGAGSDVIVVSDGMGAALTGTINGGAGTDLALFTTGSDLTATSGARFTDFQILGGANDGAATTLQSFNTSLISGLTGYLVEGSSGSVQLTALPAAPTVTVVGKLTGTNAAGALSLKLTNASGILDSVTLVLDNQDNGDAPQIGSLQLGGVTPGQVETLNIVSGGTIRNADPGSYNTVVLANSGAGPNFVDPNTINVTGSQGMALATGVLGHSITVNAAAATGGLQFTSAAGTTGANFTTNVNGTTANDTITYGAHQTGTVLGGGGGDIIALDMATQAVTVVYKAASDSLLDFNGTAGASGSATPNTGKMDVIRGFASGMDKIQLIDLGAAFNAPQVIADKGLVASTALAALLATSTFFQDSTNIVRHVAEVGYLGGTLLMADVDNNGVYSSGDLAVYLAGVTHPVASDLVGS